MTAALKMASRSRRSAAAALPEAGRAGEGMRGDWDEAGCDDAEGPRAAHPAVAVVITTSTAGRLASATAAANLE
jgi:hypothetical protein